MDCLPGTVHASQYSEVIGLSLLNIRSQALFQTSSFQIKLKLTQSKSHIRNFSPWITSRFQNVPYILDSGKL